MVCYFVGIHSVSKEHSIRMVLLGIMNNLYVYTNFETAHLFLGKNKCQIMKDSAINQRIGLDWYKHFGLGD